MFSSDLSERLDWLFRAYLIPSMPSKSRSEFSSICNDPAQAVGALGEPLQKNPLYLHLLFKVPLLDRRITAWREQEATTPHRDRIVVERIIQLLGKSATRNVLLAGSLKRALPGGLSRRKNDKAAIDPQKDLKYALLAEVLCTEQKMTHPEGGYFAGLHFDWLALALSSNKASKDISTLLEAAWTQGLRQARLAYKIAALLKRCPYPPYIFGSALVLESGKVLMALLYPKELGEKSYAHFLATTEKDFTDHLGAMRALQEKAVFEITYPEAACLFISSFSYFHPVQEAIRFAYQPEYLVKGADELHQLACILGLASNLVEQEGKPLILNSLLLSTLETIQLKPSQLKALWEETKTTGAPK